MFFISKLLNSKESLAQYLTGHRRYDTMNSWNGQTSYSNVCKVHSLGLRGTQLDKAYELIGMPDLWSQLRSVIDDFTMNTSGAYTIGTNGRSGGHLVLYTGEYYDLGHKSRCTKCGKHFNRAVQDGHSGSCDVCNSPRVNLERPVRAHRAHTKGIDQDMSFEDFMALSKQELKDKADLVRSFDQSCEDLRTEFISVIQDYMVVEETVMVPKTVRRLERVW